MKVSFCLFYHIKESILFLYLTVVYVLMFLTGYCCSTFLLLGKINNPPPPKNRFSYNGKNTHLHKIYNIFIF